MVANSSTGQRPVLLRALVIHLDAFLECPAALGASERVLSEASQPTSVRTSEGAALAPSAGRVAAKELIEVLVAAEVPVAVVSSSSSSVRTAIGLCGQTARRAPLVHVDARKEGCVEADHDKGSTNNNILDVKHILSALGCSIDELCELWLGDKEASMFSNEERLASIGFDVSQNAPIEMGVNNAVVNDLKLVPLAVAALNRIRYPSLLVVGYIMRKSRARKFQKLGALAQLDSHRAISFVPLHFSPESHEQSEPAGSVHVKSLCDLPVDMILHKLFDEVINSSKVRGAYLHASSKLPKIDVSLQQLRLCFSEVITTLQSGVKGSSNTLWVDEIPAVTPLLDRQCLYKLNEMLAHKWSKYNHTVRTPRCTQLLYNLNAENLKEAMEMARISLPCILKVCRLSHYDMKNAKQT